MQFKFWSKLDLRGLRRFQRLIASSGRGSKLGNVLAEIGDIYWHYLRNRFISLSAGSGGWPPLKESTIKRKERRIRQFGFTTSPHWILRESNTLLGALGVDYTKDGVVVGFIKDKPYPAKIRRSGMSVYQVAEVHQRTRPIIVEPSRATITKANRLMKDTMDDMVEDSKQ